jgi:hypothetical protein
MTDDLGPINRVSQHFLNRRARQEAYQGRHAKKQQEHEPESPDTDDGAVTEEGAGKVPAKSHIDVRI